MLRQWSKNRASAQDDAGENNRREYEIHTKAP
jgi:hypothetical protein